MRACHIDHSGFGDQPILGDGDRDSGFTCEPCDERLEEVIIHGREHEDRDGEPECHLAQDDLQGWGSTRPRDDPKQVRGAMSPRRPNHLHPLINYVGAVKSRRYSTPATSELT